MKCGSCLCAVSSFFIGSTNSNAGMGQEIIAGELWDVVQEPRPVCRSDISQCSGIGEMILIALGFCVKDGGEEREIKREGWRARLPY